MTLTASAPASTSAPTGLPSGATEAAASAPFFLFRPFAAVGRGFFAFAAYLGSAKLLALAAFKATFKTPSDSREHSLRAACADQLAWMLGMGMPLAILINASIAALLAMQAYYGATFVQAAGPVVLIGMFRNGSPLLVGYLLAGLIGVRIVSELTRDGWTRSPARIAAERIIAAMLAGAILNLVGALAGTVFGSLAAKRYLGVPYARFIEDGWSMVWLRDIVSLILKGVIYGGIAALFACLEGLRLPSEPDKTHRACYRACLIAAFAIFFVNSAWFILLYKAGPAFGPTVLNPPTVD